MNAMTFLMDYGLIIASIVAAVLIPLWVRSRGRTSIYAQDESVSDVAFSTIGQIGDRGAETGIDGRTEMRPPFGQRVLAPVFAIGLLLGYDFRLALADLGVTDPTTQTYIMVAFWCVVGLAVLEMNFRQRIVYDEHQISAWGLTLRRQDRDLSQLIGIRMHDHRPVLALSFEDGSELHVPKHLNGRSKFLADMDAVIRRNQGPLVLSSKSRMDVPFRLEPETRVRRSA